MKYGGLPPCHDIFTVPSFPIHETGVVIGSPSILKESLGIVTSITSSQVSG